jgi:DNA helicase IV
LADHLHGTVCVIGAPAPLEDRRVTALHPRAVKGLEFDLVVLVDPAEPGTGISDAVDRYVAMTRATQQLIILRH